MKLKFYTLLCISFLFLFSACEQDDDPIPAEKVTRTVLVYIMGDNSLTDRDDLAEEDINEMVLGMEQVNASQYNLLVYVDKLKSVPVLYHIFKNPKGEVVKESIKEYSEQISTDPAVLQEVLARISVEYPADSYGLVLWSHGEGWIPSPLPAQKNTSTRWIGEDVTGDVKTYLNISDIASVLSKFSHLEFLLIDACFGQAVEVAYELRQYADYIIGSPTEIPGPGAPYDKVVPAMFADTNVGVAIGEAYYEPYLATYTGVSPDNNEDWTGGVSIAVIKCDALDELASVTKQTIEGVESLNSGIIYDYDKRRKSNRSYIGYYDMRQLMQQLSKDINAWTVAADNAIIYWKSTPKNYSGFIRGMFPLPQEETCGISHYIPKSPNSLNSPEAAAYRSTAWYKDAGLDKIGW